jgi:hypothetical protein
MKGKTKNFLTYISTNILWIFLFLNIHLLAFFLDVKDLLIRIVESGRRKK